MLVGHDNGYFGARKMNGARLWHCLSVIYITFPAYISNILLKKLEK